MKDQLTAAGSCVYRLLQALKTDSSLLKVSDCINQVSEGASQSVKPPDNKGVASSKVGECFGQSFALSFCAGDSIGKDLLTARRLKGITLEIKVLIVG